MANHSPISRKPVSRPEVIPRFVISPIYTFVFLWFEPFAALGGSTLLLFDPQAFLRTMSPTLTLSVPSHRVIYQQLSATYVLFALNELVLLRIAMYGLQANDALRVWRTVLAIILLCDILHLWGSWEALGSKVFFDPRLWRWEDWVNLGSLWGQGAVRVAFLCGIGAGFRQERYAPIQPRKAPRKKAS